MFSTRSPSSVIPNLIYGRITEHRPVKAFLDFLSALDYEKKLGAPIQGISNNFLRRDLENGAIRGGFLMIRKRLIT